MEVIVACRVAYAKKDGWFSNQPPLDPTPTKKFEAKFSTLKSPNVAGLASL